MQTSAKRRVIGVLGIVLASQLLTACVVLPVPHRSRAVVVHPGHAGPPAHHHPRHHDRHDRHWRR
jgi:hypothetical protein